MYLMMIRQIYWLNIINYENGEDIIYKKDLIKYENELKEIIRYFKDKELLEEKENKYIIKGSVLNKVSIKNKD